MCILMVALHCHPAFPFICAHNRDEQPNRPSEGDALEADTSILCGRDRQAGGMVLGLHAQNGNFAVLTNCRSSAKHEQATSRGVLVDELVTHGVEALDTVLANHAFNGFHIVAGRVCCEHPELKYVWNVPIEDGLECPADGETREAGRKWEWRGDRATLEQGVFVVSNENWSFTAAWPKSTWLKAQAEAFLQALPQDATPEDVHAGLEKLMGVSELPGIGLPDRLPTFWDSAKETFAQQRVFLPVSRSPDFATVSQRILVSDSRTQNLEYFHRLVHTGLTPWQHQAIPWPSRTSAVQSHGLRSAKSSL
mmetsp:Transcript_26985/g.49645  ORF Transcript_26985/g.49645 Transcript_26985/m.49645 type:complete len:308 (-) Transcript_26985:150-1073(-)